jgi:hypothetical protein
VQHLWHGAKCAQATPDPVLGLGFRSLENKKGIGQRSVAIELKRQNWLNAWFAIKMI